MSAVLDGASGKPTGLVSPGPMSGPRERVALAHDPLYMEYRTSVLEFLYHRQSRPMAREAA